MTFNHSGAYLASADKTGVIKYFEPNMNNLTAWQGSNSREAIRDISFCPDDQRFATASDDSSIRIWSFAESRVESVLTGKPCRSNIQPVTSTCKPPQVMAGMSNAHSGIQQKVSSSRAPKTISSNSGIHVQEPVYQRCMNPPRFNLLSN